MRRLVPLLAVAALAMAACGAPAVDDPAPDPEPVPATTTTTTTTTPETTTTTEPEDEVTRIHVVYRDGEVVEGGGRHQVTLGSEVEIRVEADVTDEVHVHGYDLFGDVAPGEPGVIRFTADIPGIFEVELETTHRLLFELRVDP